MGVAFVFQEQPPINEKYLHRIVSAVKILALTCLVVKHIKGTITAFEGEFLTRGVLLESCPMSSRVDFLLLARQY